MNTFVLIVGSSFLILFSVSAGIAILKECVRTYYVFKKGRIEIKLLKRKYKREIEVYEKALEESLNES